MSLHCCRSDVVPESGRRRTPWSCTDTRSGSPPSEVRDPSYEWSPALWPDLRVWPFLRTCCSWSHNNFEKWTSNNFNFLRVESWSRILDLLNQTGHVLEKEVVQVLLLHVLQLEDGFILGGHGDDVWVRLSETLIKDECCPRTRDSLVTWAQTRQ